MADRKRLRQALLLCVREHDWSRAPDGLEDLLDPPTLTRLIEQGRRHQVSSFVYLSLRNLDTVDGQTLTALEAEYLAGLATQLKICADLAAAASALKSSGISFLVLKGPALAELVYDRADLRTYTDLDLLVHPRDFKVAYEALEAMNQGASLPSINWGLLGRLQAGQLSTALPGNSVCDLHWHLLSLRGLRESSNIWTEELFERSQPVNLKGTATSTLAAEDQLLHSCLHASTSGSIRLKWVKDIERCAAYKDIDWPTVVERAKQWKVSARVGASLYFAASTIGVELPEGVVRSLVQSRFGRAADSLVADRWTAKTRASVFAPSVFWMRTRGSSPRATLRTAGSYLRRKSLTVGASFNPGSNWSQHADKRGSFFDLVAAQDRPRAPQSEEFT
ncbi:MAG: nucleotidyltransferase family protein [Actinobacteria bacterium]|nr:nucleotidyltransferase family protein [Actinomycetota bacterium]